MKILHTSALLLLALAPVAYAGEFQALPADSAATATALPGCVDLDGKAATPNPVEKDGRILHFKAPAVRLMRTTADKPKGTVLIFPSGGYYVLSVVD
jgi:hypothetical protein